MTKQSQAVRRWLLMLIVSVGLWVGLLYLRQSAAHGETSAASNKVLSTNFAIVNMTSGANSGEIHYYRADGSAWRGAEPFQFSSASEQLIKRQYEEQSGLDDGRGSVIISATGALGTVVQILARTDPFASSSAYVAVTSGAPTVYVPLVMRKRPTFNGEGNSHIYVQNTASNRISVELELIDPTGTTTLKKSLEQLAPGITALYDLASEDAVSLPDGWFGSAVVRATSADGTLAAVSSLFTGEHGVQTFNAFASKRQRWLVPLFTARLENSLSTPLAVQNLSGQTIPVGGVNVNCKGDPASPVSTLTLSNAAPINNTAAYYFNPIIDTAITGGFFGACTIDTAGYDTVAFVQMRFVKGDQAAAYEALPGDSTSQEVAIPLYAKRLACGFATAVTIQNVSASQDAHVDLVYKGDVGTPENCSLTKRNITIAAGGSLIQNHRLDQTGPGAVPELGNTCFGTLTVTSTDQPIEAFVQLTSLGCGIGDAFMAHSALPKPATTQLSSKFYLPVIMKKYSASN